MRQPVNSLGNFLQSLRTVVNSIHSRHDRQQDLSRANIGRCFFPPNVLLAGLQGHAVARMSLRIHRGAYDPARHLALVFILGGKEGSVWAAETHGYSETLAGADN